MKAVSIIRDRGQLTIPDSIRQLVSWVAPLSAVTISVRKADEIVITPHQNYVNWEGIWEGIKKSRAIKGKGSINAAKFLEFDRNSH
ncbi:hypothetical protein M1555_02370 [Patescibacteria group bacterium]|nr:hypothetical protein [Patescibacteria group bacterium]